MCRGGRKLFSSSFLSLILLLSLSSVSVCVCVCVWISLMDIRKFRYFIQPVYTTSYQFSTLRNQSPEKQGDLKELLLESHFNLLIQLLSWHHYF